MADKAPCIVEGSADKVLADENSGLGFTLSRKFMYLYQKVFDMAYYCRKALEKCFTLQYNNAHSVLYLFS